MMKIFRKYLSILIAIAIEVLISDIAIAQDFKIGSVEQQIATDGVCLALLPNTQKNMLVITFPHKKSEPVFAWMNIDGKDVRLRQVSLKIIVPKNRSIAKYRANNISVTIDSRQIKEKQGQLTSTATVEKISIDYGGKKKNINTSGRCVF